MVYKIVRFTREEVDAPELTADDLMSMAEAAEALGVSIPAIDGQFRRGKLAVVIDEDAPPTAHKQPRRLVLRSEVERLIAEGDDQGEE